MIFAAIIAATIASANADINYEFYGVFSDSSCATASGFYQLGTTTTSCASVLATSCNSGGKPVSCGVFSSSSEASTPYAPPTAGSFIIADTFNNNGSCASANYTDFAAAYYYPVNSCMPVYQQNSTQVIANSTYINIYTYPTNNCTGTATIQSSTPASAVGGCYQNVKVRYGTFSSTGTFSAGTVPGTSAAPSKIGANALITLIVPLVAALTML